MHVDAPHLTAMNWLSYAEDCLLENPAIYQSSPHRLDHSVSLRRSSHQSGVLVRFRRAPASCPQKQAIIAFKALSRTYVRIRARQNKNQIQWNRCGDAHWTSCFLALFSSTFSSLLVPSSFIASSPIWRVFRREDCFWLWSDPWFLKMLLFDFFRANQKDTFQVVEVENLSGFFSRKL